jgi:putative ABC transport system substrate-binding protein
MSYAPDVLDLYRRSAGHGPRAQGREATTPPVQAPTKYEVINLKTAKALGLTIPETLLATATS